MSQSNPELNKDGFFFFGPCDTILNGMTNLAVVARLKVGYVQSEMVSGSNSRFNLGGERLKNSFLDTVMS